MKTEKERNGSGALASASEKLAEVYELSMLYDFYGELLGDHKKQIFEDYILNDLSLAEIADNTGISRQGVHDIIKRCTKALRGYEEKLHLAEKFEGTKQLISEIRQISEEITQTKDVGRIGEVVARAERILQEL
ncbi:MAG: YlxM family DNA-binding protein [Lachnospiraceae bacterium]|nr:YlxM family DNA-binding protein [Lachnospiraceae bacterium]